MGQDAVVLARFFLTGVAVLLAFLAAVAWTRRKETPEATTFAILVFSMAVYTFGYAGELLCHPVPTREHRMFSDFEYTSHGAHGSNTPSNR